MAACPFCQKQFDGSGQHECPSMNSNVEPQKPELERIIEVMAWAQEKGALHFKCPYFEILFPQTDSIPQKLPEPDIVADNRRAEAGITEKVPFQNPIDDPDYYSDAQEKFYNYQRK